MPCSHDEGDEGALQSSPTGGRQSSWRRVCAWPQAARGGNKSFRTAPDRSRFCEHYETRKVVQGKTTSRNGDQ